MYILIAEDDQIAAKILERTVISLGHEVCLVADGESAISYLTRKRAFDVVLLDWSLPEASGPEICKALRQMPDGHIPYVLISTSRRESSNIIEALDAGADDYLVKPVTNRDLMVRLVIAERVVRTRRQLSQVERNVERRVTEHVIAEEAAQEATKRKSEFLANMSHEIRTPLNGIISLTTLLQDTELTADQQADLQTILECAESLRGIIGDILDFSKIEAGKLLLLDSDFDPRKLIDRVIRLIEVQAQAKSLVFVPRVDMNLPARLHGDSVRVSQVLLNLLGNAIKFTPAEGGVVFGLECNPLPNGGMHLHFTIADSGIGIPADKQQMIFEAFTQADGSVTRQYGGTGLGLTICAKLAQLMGGSVRLESKPGVGSVFHFEVPLAAPSRKLEARQPTTDEMIINPVWAGQFELLVVEDDPVNLDTISRLLRRLGFKLSTARNGAEAVQIASSRKFDLILTDLQMPVMGGVDAAKALRASGGPCCEIPIVALTAFAVTDYRDECDKAGMDGFLTKPVSFIDLKRALIHNLSIGENFGC